MEVASQATKSNEDVLFYIPVGFLVTKYFLVNNSFVKPHLQTPENMQELPCDVNCRKPCQN